MTINVCLTPPSDKVKSALQAQLGGLLDTILAAALSEASARVLEMLVLAEMLRLVREVLAHAFATRCAREAELDIERRKLDRKHVTLRSDGQHTVSLMTTVGPISFPSFAYRDRSGPLPVTRRPADRVVPLRGRCRSSERCLEWETHVAGHHPYRTAQSELAYFTHGAVQLEDTTIERHAVRIGHLIDQEWCYRPLSEVASIVDERATRDATTQRPLVYWSSDAHALRRYVNESYVADWKMVNGLRIWCVDRVTGDIIHLGGEFTTGDSDYTRRRMEELLAAKIMPADGDFGGGLKAQYVFIADGMPWLKTHLASMLPGAVLILDAYHVIEHLATYSKRRGRRGQLSGKAWLAQTTAQLFGAPLKERRERQHTRKGHTKSKRVPPPPLEPPPESPQHAGKELLEALEAEKRATRCGKENCARTHEPAPDGPDPCVCDEEHSKLISYITGNLDRMDYRRWRTRGYQIGSGAMESFHRNGSQNRLKRNGARWLPETLEGMFRLRMLELVGRWDEWWSQPGFFAANAQRFVTTTYRTRTGPQASRPAEPVSACA